jgi:ribonucleoside-diphosphate reductase alpha chain
MSPENLPNENLVNDSEILNLHLTHSIYCDLLLQNIQYIANKRLFYGEDMKKKDDFKTIKLDISKNAATVLEKRYLKKNKTGKTIESPEKMFQRVASHIALAEKKYTSIKKIDYFQTAFYNLMVSFKFIPNSPTLMNAGNELGQLAACFVLPIEDSLLSIFETVKNAALIHKSGGGTGFSFSRLRAKDCRVGSTGGVASGPVSFMKIFNVATEQVKQGGTRRGANMAVLRIDHPDIMEFIHCKENNNILNNFNISVGITDRFIAAVRKDKAFDLIDPRNRKKSGQINAREVFKAIVKQAWHNGDPGIIFLDRINQDNPTPAIGEIESTNPCGEQPLLPMEACNLGSINLSKFVGIKKEKPFIDYKSLKETVHLSVRFLDNAIDMSTSPLSEIDHMVKGNRKIGLGLMGFSDLLFQLKIPYSSEKALSVAEQIMAFIQKESHKASRLLAEERGPFKNFDKSIFKGNKEKHYRNATTTTIAPTGTLSIIAGCSSGIEPLFALSFVRRVMDNDELIEVNPYFEKIARERGFYSEKLMNKIANTGSISNLHEIPQDIRDIFVTAHDISPSWHIRMQAAFQKFTDNAVSKTVNLPHDATEEDVMGIYNMSYDLGCKGVTIYRDGSKSNQVLSFSNDLTKEDSLKKAIKERPDTLQGFTTRIKTGMGQLYVTVNENDGKPFEIFATIGKSGKSTTAKTEAIGRLVSLCLRTGVDIKYIIKQIKGIGGEYAIFQKGGRVLSIPDAIARVLEKRYGIVEETKQNNSLKKDCCPECGSNITHEEGCITCHSCGFTKCG